VIGPSRRFIACQSLKLLRTSAPIRVRIIQDCSFPGWAVQRIQIIRNVSCNFAEDGEIAGNHWSSVAQRLDQRQTVSFNQAGEQ